MTAGMVGFGALLLVRHRLRGKEPELARVEGARAKQAGRAIVTIAAILTLMVLGIVVAHLSSGRAIALLSLLMPAVGLAWLGWIGWRSFRHQGAASDAQLPDADRPSRRPPDWQRPSARATSRAGSDRHASA
jgi:threonine/homoserine/homoserine lactone efflux protein